MSVLNTTDITDDELVELNAQFETQPAAAIIGWAVESFHPHLCLTASMTDAVLIDLATSVEPAIEVVFIDTGYHFPETLETVERGAPALRAQPAGDDRSRPRGGAVEGRPGELLLGRQVRPARSGPFRQAGLDERPAPGGGGHPGVGADRAS